MTNAETGKISNKCAMIIYSLIKCGRQVYVQLTVMRHAPVQLNVL